MFTQATVEALGWYVYLLKDPRNGEVFYVGKGCGQRLFQHIAEASKTNKSTDKLDRIREIQDEGYSVIHVVHRHGLESESTAFEVEAAIIDLIPGLTNAVKGHGVTRGPATAKQINEMYDVEIANLDGLNVMMIKINNSYGKMSVEDATCFSWRVNAKKMMKADVILGVANGIIRCALEPKGWEFSSPVKHKKLWDFYGFDPLSEESNSQRKRKVIWGIPASHDIQDKFVGKGIPEEFSMKGSQQALRYNY